MKLNAPNPQPEQTGPVSPTDEQPAVASPPPAAAPVASQPRKVVAWPEWFAGADFVLATLAVLLAFFLASFVARNSDLWLHLAAGQRLLDGQYRLGTDPFSYTAADRTWVNPSWLYDLALAALYRDSGALLVVLKALAVAAAFLLLLLVRPPGRPLWPWAVTAALAAVAAAPHLHLRPQIVSILLLAVTLFLTFRMPHRPGSWRFPVAIGIAFCLWSNCDEWFLLGPFALGLILIGEILQRLLRGPDPGASGATPDQPAGTLLRPPAVPTLAQGLAVGVLACMVNPHHVGVWQLPFELVGDKAAALEPRLKVLMTSPLSRLYTDNTGLGYNLNGLAYATLFLGGGLALALTGKRVRGGVVVLWLGFALLSLLSILAIPFLAVVAVPVIAGAVNALSAGLTLRGWGDPRTRFLLLGSALGRVFCTVLLLVGCVCAWPGWLHPPTSNEAFARRVAWAVVPDEAMVKAAKQLQDWRASGLLPPDSRGLIASIELANYCAYFAPLEKVFINGRPNHHRPELTDYITVRTGLGLIPVEEAPDPNELFRVLQERGAEYTAIHSGPSDSSRLRELAQNSSFVQWNDKTMWSPWYLDGRTAVSGWRPAPGRERPSFERLRLDPVRLAFGPQTSPLPVGKIKEPPKFGGWEDAFLRTPVLSPAAADESLGWTNFKAVAQARRQRQQFGFELSLFLLDRLAGGRGVLLVGLRNRSLVPSDDSTVATPFLSLWAARRAIVAEPDHPDGYYALALALEDPELPMSEDDRFVARATALRQCLVRFPPPERFRPGTYSASPTEVATRLAEVYLNRRPDLGQTYLGLPVNLPSLQVLSLPGEAGYLRATGFLVDSGGGRLARAWVGLAPPQVRVAGPYLLPLDLARESFQTAEKYAVVELREDRQKAFLDAVKSELKRVESELVRANTAYEQLKLARGGQMKLRDQVEAALRNNLVGEALNLLRDRTVNFAVEFGQTSVPAALSRIALEMAVGRIEDAASDLDELQADADFQQQLANDVIRFQVRMLNYHRLSLEGNYAEAGAILEEVGLRSGSDEDPPLTPEQQKIKNPQALAAWLSFLPNAVSSDPPLLTIAREQLIGTLLMPFVERQQQLARRRAVEAEFFYRRGILFLFEGNVPEAEKRLLRTRQVGVKEWGVPDQQNAAAERFLRLIDEARRRAAQR